MLPSLSFFLPVGADGIVPAVADDPVDALLPPPFSSRESTIAFVILPSLTSPLFSSLSPSTFFASSLYPFIVVVFFFFFFFFFLRLSSSSSAVGRFQWDGVEGSIPTEAAMTTAGRVGRPL